MNKHLLSAVSVCCAAAITASGPAQACTGIAFEAKDGTRIQARTIEWSGYDLKAKLAFGRGALKKRPIRRRAKTARPGPPATAWWGPPR